LADTDNKYKLNTGVALLASLLLIVVAFLAYDRFFKSDPPGPDVIVKRENTVYCDPVPPAAEERLNSAEIKGAVEVLKSEVLKVGAGMTLNTDPLSKGFFSAQMRRDDFLAIPRGLCLDLANKAITPAEYASFKATIIPILLTKVEKQSRFDSEVTKVEVRTLPNAAGTRVTLDLRFFPMTENNAEVATVFYGLVVVHDEDLAKPIDPSSSVTPAKCSDVPSCLTGKVLDLRASPILVRGGMPGVTVPIVLDVAPAQWRGKPKYVRLYWEFYQSEADNARCEVDPARAGPEEGLPYFRTVSSDQSKGVNAQHCYRSVGLETRKLPES